MKVNRLRLVCACLTSFLILTSCTLVKRYTQLSPGELRLVGLQIPDFMEENMPYEAVISFTADGRPQVHRMCFRWISENTYGSSTVNYWGPNDPSASPPVTSSPQRWATEGKVWDSSPQFCVGRENIKEDVPGRMLVRLTGRGIKSSYSNIECFAEYLRNGEIVESNKVSSRITTQR